MLVFSYTPEKFQLIVGSEEVTGFAKDTSVTVRRPEKRIEYTPGMRKDGVRVFNPNLHAEIVINLLMGSPTNRALFNYLNANETEPGTGDFSLSLVDKNGNGGSTIIEVSAPVCWVTSTPEYVWSGNHEVRSWNLESGNCVWTQSGVHTTAAASN